MNCILGCDRAGCLVDEVKAEYPSAPAQCFELAGAMELVVGSCARIVVDKLARHDAVDEQGQFAGSGGDGLGLAGPRGEAAVKSAERGRSTSEYE